ncbi:response regulator [Acetobacterium paludosum]|uniref:Stage 0 sporulation protein A homolog n=1 Tax=Acetobacterium paludosum TaxID=52693 RepID=A0A923HSQ8_9FIRM|nr:response regulator [Acetobacterium paludosum]MBC3887948.1 response regulator [Acetobacterium paludosum]
MARILIVDDSAVSRKKLRIILEAAKHEIIGEAGDGFEGLQKYEELIPDLVTMDITMPRVDGITGLKDILKLNPTARIVMVTALGKGSTILEALDAGAKNYITKPFSEDTVIHTIAEALK